MARALESLRTDLVKVSTRRAGRFRQAMAAEHYRKADEQDEAQQRPGGRPTAETVYAKESDVHSSERPSGNSQAAYLRRLRKDRRDIHQRVLAGGKVVWRDRVVVQLQKSGRPTNLPLTFPR
jgi:hypothetical protein